MAKYIIVGAGLSGIAMAEELLNSGHSIKVFDNNFQAASKVAGGLMNPVILKRFTLAWNADNQLKRAKNFYLHLEEKLSSSFFKELPVYRKFHSFEEQNDWFLAADKPALEPFLNTALEKAVNEHIPSSFGFGKINHTAVVDTAKLLSEYKKYLKTIDFLSEETFDYNLVKIQDQNTYYDHEACKGIIFCEGMGLKNNKFFNYLPINGNKGEYIIIKAEELKLEFAVKSSIFILPQGNDLYKIGATYDNNDKTLKPTSTAKEYLEKKLSATITCQYKIVDQVAGLRPASADRRPLVGVHPIYKNLYCCNGFGSRGVLIAPTVAQHVLETIEKGIPLPSEININRFKKRFTR